MTATTTCPRTGVPAKYCTCVNCAKPAPAAEQPTETEPNTPMEKAMTRKKHKVEIDYTPFQNRLGPEGQELSEDEAIAWFPPLDEPAGAPSIDRLPEGVTVTVGIEGLVFYLENVRASAEAGWYFGDITEHLPQNEFELGPGQNIGFRLCNVYGVRASA